METVFTHLVGDFSVGGDDFLAIWTRNVRSEYPSTAAIGQVNYYRASGIYDGVCGHATLYQAGKKLVIVVNH